MQNQTFQYFEITDVESTVTHRISPVTEYYQLLEKILEVFPQAKFSKLKIQFRDFRDDSKNDFDENQDGMDLALTDQKGQPNIHFFIKIETPAKDAMPLQFATKTGNTPEPKQKPSGNMNRPLKFEHSPANPMQMSQIQPRKDHFVKFSQNMVNDNAEIDGESFEKSDHEDVQESGNVPVVANSHQTVFSEPARSGN